MSEIDWIKAPEGFQIWIEPLPRFNSWPADWHRVNGEFYTDRQGRSWAKEDEGNRFVAHRMPMKMAGLARRVAIGEMIAVMRSTMSTLDATKAQALYDAGYRKQEAS